MNVRYLRHLGSPLNQRLQFFYFSILRDSLGQCIFGFLYGCLTGKYALKQVDSEMQDRLFSMGLRLFGWRSVIS